MEFNRFQMFWMMPEAQESLVTAVIFKKITRAHLRISLIRRHLQGKWANGMEDLLQTQDASSRGVSMDP